MVLDALPYMGIYKCHLHLWRAMAGTHVYICTHTHRLKCAPAFAQAAPHTFLAHAASRPPHGPLRDRLSSIAHPAQHRLQGPFRCAPVSAEELPHKLLAQAIPVPATSLQTINPLSPSHTDNAHKRKHKTRHTRVVAQGLSLSLSLSLSLYIYIVCYVFPCIPGYLCTSTTSDRAKYK
jgi:hypothetical protein